ncbi:MAG: branched-chain amino acid ABC transporter permease [Burkholderiaceae bacterium]
MTLVWVLSAIIMIVLPQLFSSGFAITLMSQMGIMIVFCLSYNMLLGQGGMLSFGHAVYSGLGAFYAIHTMNWMAQGAPWLPVSLIPLVGGLAGAFFGIVLGFVTTKKSGTTFAMITLGIGELVFAMSLMFPDFFGGEGGITTDRVIGQPFMGITFGSGIQVYYLIAVWCLLSMVGMYAFSCTPLGRISNAVRDNPERAEFIGYNTQRVRYLVLIVSAFFAGISGGLSAINFEIVSAENVSAIRSGGVLLATFIGGSMFFGGPIIGAIVFVLFAVALSDYTRAWQFYLGAFFVLMVLFAPGGLASLIMMNVRMVRQRMIGRLLPHYLAVLVTGAVLLAATILVIELGYHRLLEAGGDPTTTVFGIAFDTASGATWAAVIALLVVGGAGFRWAQQRFIGAWDAAEAAVLASGVPAPR